MKEAVASDGDHNSADVICRYLFVEWELSDVAVFLSIKKGKEFRLPADIKKRKKEKAFFKEDFVPSLCFIILMEVCERFVFNLLSN